VVTVYTSRTVKQPEGRTPIETFEENLSLAKEKISGMNEEDLLTVAG